MEEMEATIRMLEVQEVEVGGPLLQEQMLLCQQVEQEEMVQLHRVAPDTGTSGCILLYL